MQLRRSSLGGKVLYGPVTNVEQETEAIMRKKQNELHMNSILSTDISRRNNSRLINRINQLDLENQNVSKAKSVVQEHKNAKLNQEKQ
jgi:hypothetical protein